MRDPRLKDRAWCLRVGFDNIMTEDEVRRAAFGGGVLLLAALAVAIVGLP